MGNNKFMENIGKFFTWILMFTLMVFLRGMVLMFLWKWFMVPLGLPEVGFWLVMGISQTISVFMGIKVDEKKAENTKFKDSIKDFAISCLLNLAFLGMGAIIHMFI